jgi:murein DD-endopeptidase MepM/ murein hydrolase activator NlpD
MLNKYDVSQLEKRLSKLRLSEIVKIEVLDHYISSIEHKMVVGVEKEQAIQEAFEEFPIQEVKIISEMDKRLKRKAKMKRILFPSLLVGSVAALFFALFIKKQEDDTWGNPVGLDDLTRIASGFGMREHPIYKTKKMHTGIDYVAPLGAPVFPVHSAKVVEVIFADKGYGNQVVLQHNDSVQTLYAQLDKVLVKVGEKVSVKDTIGLVGSSGNSTAPHLHFETIINGLKVNPIGHSVFIEENSETNSFSYRISNEVVRSKLDSIYVNKEKGLRK